MNLKSTVALVTGANRGIGREIVAKLLLAGAPKVYAVARDAATLGATVGLDPARVVPLQADVSDRAAVDALAARAADVTLLVNNAGVLDFGDVLDAEPAAFERNFAVNLFGTLNATRAFAPVIEARGGGAVVNILTLVALASMPGLGVYNASKAAAWSLTQSLRASLGRRGIAVIGVFPAAVDTDMLAAVDIPKTSPADVAEAIVAGIAAGREDIFPDPMSARFYAAWREDHKAVERQFAAM
jgi:NAD(P)-dependent dehydrogenase (short-subunit alcohol dehydrogenase family)